MAQQLPQACRTEAKNKVPTNGFVFLTRTHIKSTSGSERKFPNLGILPHPEVSSDLIPVTKPTPADAKSPL